MMRPLTLALALCAFALFACSPAPIEPATPTRIPVLPTSESTAQPTRPATAVQVTPTEAPLAPEPLATPESTSSPMHEGWSDDFSNPGSGWDISTGKEGSVGYESGEYVIQVDEADYSLWANPGQTFGNVVVRAKAQLADDSLPAAVGVICRYQDADNFIYGEITSDGFYSITQVKKGDLSVLTGGGKLQRDHAIHQDNAANQIQLLCAGNRFTLIVNDRFIDQVEAEAPASGDVGLIAGAFEKAGVRVRFDDFSAVLPPPGTEAGTGQPGGNLLFSDDFSDPQSGWGDRTTESGASGYQDGRYFIRVDKPKYQLWSSPGRTFPGDVVVEVTAGLASGPKENEMGVICRYQDKQNFVYGSIGTDGYYAIVEVRDDKTNILTGNGTFQPSAAVPVGDETYVIRLGCQGDRYTLFVNGEEIDSASSSALSGGNAGLLAGTFDQGGVEVLFDDFMVSTP